MRSLPGVIACFLLVPLNASSQPSDVIVEGSFGDWETRPPVYTDPQDQPVGGIDFERLWVDNDDRFLFLSIVVGSEEISLQNESSITLLLDTDDNPATGRQAAGIGAELVWVFGERAGVFHGANTVAVGHRDIGLISAPTVTSTRFELALDLSAEPKRQGPLFPQDTIAVAFEAGVGEDVLPDAGEKVQLIIDRAVPEREYDYVLERELESDLRISAWNVERDGLFDDNLANDFGGLLTAIDPDLIGFSEIYEHTVGQTLDRLETLLPSEPGETWFGDGPGSDIVLASRYPITRSFKSIARGSAAAFLVDLSSRGADKLLVALAHLRCCEFDAVRQRQVDEMMAFVRDSKVDGTLAANTPIVLMGDMNFVGDRRQLTTLTDGDIVNPLYQPSFEPDWDGSPFTDRRPLTTGMPAAYTWPGRGDDFSPGRLDFIVYSDFVMEAGKAFALNTPTIPLDELQRLGMSAVYTIRASDHLPLVADFRGPSVTAWDDEQPSSSDGRKLLTVFPNPASGFVNIEIEGSSGVWFVSISDVLGRRVVEQRSHRIAHGAGPVRLDLSDVAPGLYTVRAWSEAGLQFGGAVITIR